MDPSVHLVVHTFRLGFVDGLSDFNEQILCDGGRWILAAIYFGKIVAGVT